MVNFHVRLGTVFLDLSMLPHVNNVCKSAFYHLRTISCIEEQLSMQTTEILIHAFVTCKLDHCNSLLYNHHHHHIMPLKTSSKSFNRCRMQLPDRLHALGSVITPILFDLHWLPVSERIQFKILLLKALHQQSPTYIQDLITHYLPFTLSLNPVSFNLKTYGSRAFAVWTRKLWNKLPDDIRSCENLSLFKKTLNLPFHLFKNYYFSH